MTNYTELANELRAIEKVCRDRLDGQPILEAAKALEELEAYCKELLHAPRVVQKMPNRGAWVWGDKMPQYPRIPYKPFKRYCTACGEMSPFNDKEDESDYCPNCGAKMGGKEDEE